MVDGGKMSKSLGNLYTLEDLQKRGYSPAEVRYTLLGGHYRQPLNFTMDSLHASRQALTKLAKFEKALREKAGASNAPSHEALVRHGTAGGFQSAWHALQEDLNVPGALGGIFSHVHETKPAELSAEQAKAAWMDLHFMLDAIGIVLPEIKEDTTDVPPDIKVLADERWAARLAKDWAKSDVLRKSLEAAGWLVKDGKEGYTLLPKT
jgi:cysteinyl-tRNA synthetase